MPGSGAQLLVIFDVIAPDTPLDVFLMQPCVELNLQSELGLGLGLVYLMQLCVELNLFGVGVLADQRL